MNASRPPAVVSALPTTTPLSLIPNAVSFGIAAPRVPNELAYPPENVTAYVG